MTILNNGTRNQYTATSGQTTFIYNFEIFDQGDVVVYENTTLLSIGTHYTVTGVGVSTGGTIVLVTGATTGTKFTIFRDTTAERLADYQNSGAFLATEVNADLDRIWAVIQEMETNQTRFLQTSLVTELPLPVTLEESVTGQLLRWKDTNTIDSVSSSSITPGGAITTDYGRHVSDYATLRLINTADYADGQVVTITDAGIAGPGVLRNVVAHGLTDNGGTIIVISVDCYWERRYTGLVSPEWFGAVINSSGAASVNAAAMQAAALVGSIGLAPEETYYLNDGFALATPGRVVIGKNSKIKTTTDFNKTSDTFEVIHLNAVDTAVYGVIFDCADTDGLVTGGGAPLNNIRIIWGEPGTDRLKVIGCQFFNVGDSNTAVNLQTAIGFGVACNDCVAAYNYFNDCPGSTFSQGARTFITKNISREPRDVSYAINSTSSVGASIIDNKSIKTSGELSVHVAAEEGASDWTISDNYIFGIKDGTGIKALNVAVTTEVNGGIISDNIIDGNSQTCVAPSAMISISQYYANTKIHNNTMRNAPTGLTNNTCVSFYTNGTEFTNNKFTGSVSTAMVGCVLINCDGGSATIIDNEANAGNSSARIYTFDGGDNAGIPIMFKGGKFLGGSEGINTAVNTPTNCPVWVENIERNTCTTIINITDWGASLRGYFNTNGAWRWPHRVFYGQRIHVYGDAAPVNGDWQQGDEVVNSAPSASNPDGWRCVIDGTPGTWKAKANLSA